VPLVGGTVLKSQFVAVVKSASAPPPSQTVLSAVSAVAAVIVTSGVQSEGP